MTSTSPRICKRIWHIYLHTNKQEPNNKHVSRRHTRPGRPAARPSLHSCSPAAVYQTNALTTVHYFGLLEQNKINDNNNHRRRGWIGQKNELSEYGSTVFGTSLGEELWALFSAGQVYRPSSQCMLTTNCALSTFTATDWHLRHHVIVLQDVSAVRQETVVYQQTSLIFFMCCWPYILVIFDFLLHLNAPFLYYIYHIPLHVSSNIMLIIRRIHCIHTASGSLYVTLLRWPLSAQAVGVL